jgi:hypothetical protein
MAFFHLYVDESGKLAGKSDYTSLCGYVGYMTEWIRFSTEWDHCRLKWQVPPIHMGQIFALNPKHEGWRNKRVEWGTQWEDRRDAMLGEFAHLVRLSHLVCVGMVVDANACRDIRDNHPYDLYHKDSNVLVFSDVILQALRKVETVDKDASLTISVDDDEEHAFNYYDSLRIIKNLLQPAFQKVRNRVHALAFSKDDHYPGLQIADMIAYEARSLMVKRLTDKDVPSSSLYTTLTHGGMHQPKLLTSEILHKVAKGAADVLEAQ